MIDATQNPVESILIRYDRVHVLPTPHRMVRRMMGHGLMDDEKQSQFQILKDNLMLFMTHLSFEERLGLVVDSQMTAIDNRRLTTKFKTHQVRLPTAIEDLNYRADCNLDRATAMSKAHRLPRVSVLAVWGVAEAG